MSVTQNWKFVFFLLGAFTLQLAACALWRSNHASSPGITPEEVQLLHPIGRYMYQQRKISAEQTDWIRSHFGERYLPASGKVEYIYVQPDRNRGPHPQAYVFKARGGSPHGKFAILVCQSGGKVNELYLLEGSTADGTALESSFLQPFAGMKVVDPGAPEKSKPLPRQDDLSQEMAEAIRGVLIQAVALGL